MIKYSNYKSTNFVFIKNNIGPQLQILKGASSTVVIFFYWQFTLCSPLKVGAPSGRAQDGLFALADVGSRKEPWVLYFSSKCSVDCGPGHWDPNKKTLTFENIIAINLILSQGITRFSHLNFILQV